MDFSPANCRNCYKCLRTCPVKAIRMLGDQAVIDEERCVGCGACLVVCPQNARSVLSDLDHVAQAIQEGRQVVASVAPSYKGIYEDEAGFIGRLYGLGFDKVEETALGAETVHEAYQKLIRERKQEQWITSCCPVVIDYVQKYHHELAGRILPVVSPMIAHGSMMKARYGREAVVVFIGPCVAKKKEAMVHDAGARPVDYVLTFEEVDSWMAHLPGGEGGRVPEGRAGAIGGSFPLEQGIIGNLDTSHAMEKIAVAGFEWMDNAFHALAEGEIGSCIIEANACLGGCANGPAISRERKKTVVNTLRLKKRMDGLPAGLQEADAAASGTAWHHKPMPLKARRHEERDLWDVLKAMGKSGEADLLNCGACGYDTCRGNAAAVLEGMSHPQTCIPNMRTRAERMINSLFTHTPNGVLILDEQLRIVEFNPAAERIFGKTSSEMLHNPVDILFHPCDFIQARTTGHPMIDKKVYLKDYGLSVSLSIIHLAQQHLFLALMHNLTEEEKRSRALKELRESTLDTAQTVISKQMRVAQEIASLLGETTAETKVALMKLQKLVKTDEGDER